MTRRINIVFLSKLASLLFFLSPISFATPCDTLPGTWFGNWADQTNHSFRARLQIKQNSHNTFNGKFYLSNNSDGPLHGICKAINSNEAVLTLGEDPPLNNPCRGLLLQTNQTLDLHIFCFDPNQAGYFQKVS